MALLVFWISAAAIIYTYAGYPLIIWLAARIRPRAVKKADITPFVSVVVACHNEAANIGSKISNLLESDYPPERLEIVVVSDGSTDLTRAVVEAHASDRLRLIAYAPQRGKADALNLGVAITKGDIIVFADARQQFERSAIRELARNFAEETVGAVSGELTLKAGPSLVEAVGLYWRYEKSIRRSEGLACSVIGATGAIYAIRRELWKPLPPATILDDVFTPMQIAMVGRRVVFDESARAYDTVAPSREFARKVRTLTGNYQLCQLMPRLLLPTSLLILRFYSHKLLRLAAPLFLLSVLAANVAIVLGDAAGPRLLFFETSLAMQLLFYAGVIIAALMPKNSRPVRFLSVAYTFSMMNLAAVLGLVCFILGKRDVWQRARG